MISASCVIYLPAASHQVSAQKNMVWKMMMLKEFQDGCLVLGNFCYANGMILAISDFPFCQKPFINFLLKRIYGLVDFG